MTCETGSKRRGWLAAPSEVNLYYLKFTKSGGLFGQHRRALTSLFRDDWRRGYFGKGLTDVPRKWPAQANRRPKWGTSPSADERQRVPGDQSGAVPVPISSKGVGDSLR